MNICVVTGTLGQPSETFVKRHIESLLETGSYVITRKVHEKSTVKVDSHRLLILEDVAPLVPLGGLSMVIKSIFLLFPNRLFSPRHNTAILEFLKRNDIDLVLSEFMDATLPLVSVLEKARIPLVVHGHGSDVSSRLKHWWWRRSYGNYRNTQIVVVSQKSKKDLTKKCNLNPQNIHVIPCAPVYLDFAARKERSGTTSPSRFEITTIGRLVEKKNPLGLIEVVNILVNQMNCKIHLSIVGDGPLFVEVEKSISHFGLQNFCSLLGELDNSEVLEVLKQSDLYIQNSRTDPITGEAEGLPVSILEAMNAGIPVIATNHAGIPEVIQHGQTGLLVREGDSREMAEAIQKILSSPKLAKTIGECGRLLVKSKLNWQQVRIALLDLFNMVLLNDKNRKDF